MRASDDDPVASFAESAADRLATPASTQTDIASGRLTAIAREVTGDPGKPQESASAQELP
jgi:hypothetical protein